MDFEAACSVYIRFRGVNGYLGTALIVGVPDEHLLELIPLQ